MDGLTKFYTGNKQIFQQTGLKTHPFQRVSYISMAIISEDCTRLIIHHNKGMYSQLAFGKWELLQVFKRAMVLAKILSTVSNEIQKA